MQKQTKADPLPSMNGRGSTVIFADRFAQAFPGVRGIDWFTDEEAIKTRLEVLLREPLVYSDGTPIWWWRDGNLHIESFKWQGDRLYLMDGAELLICKIAAVNPGPYYRSFVYVETEAMPPTGLYESTVEYIASVENEDSHFGYYWEEYGLVDGIHLINRAKYDDGAAEIDGNLEDVRGRCEIRCRYVTPYNFVIASNGSPINNPEFDKTLKDILNAMLKKEASLDELANEVLRLPKRQY